MLEAATAAMMTATEPIREEVLAAFRRAGVEVEHWFTSADTACPCVCVHVYVGGEIVKTIIGAMPKPKLLRELEPFLG